MMLVKLSRGAGEAFGALWRLAIRTLVESSEGKGMSQSGPSAVIGLSFESRGGASNDLS